MDGIALQEELAARGVKVPIIFLSAHADVPTSVRARYSGLTQREKEVLGLVVRGQLNKEIASELGAAEKTIKVHRGRVMREDGSRVACRARTAGRGTRAPVAGVANRFRWRAGARRGPAVGGRRSIEGVI
jgi:FixJ family two-component response regulator